jgi:plastocyanin
MRFLSLGSGAVAVLVAGLFADPGSAAAVAPQDATGSVKGKITFEGKVPKDRKISLEGDKYCGTARPDGLSSEYYKVGVDGAVQNVFVHVKKGLEGRKFDPPAAEVELNQVGCRYEPHVFGIMVGQALAIRNSDETLHNVHSQSKLNKEFNFGQAKKGDRNSITFDQPEVMVRVKCDVHGWMSTFAGVVSHPFYQVTGESGTFELKGLPAGSYVIEAWHEKFVAQTQDVKVEAGASPELTFTFKGK